MFFSIFIEEEKKFVQGLMSAFYDLEEDRWIFPRSPSSHLPTLRHSLPRRFPLFRTSVADEKPVHPKLQIQNILSSLHPLGPSKSGYKGSLGYIPNSVLHELLIEDIIRRQDLEERCKRRTRLRMVRFGDSVLAVHPSGQGGRRLCFSRLLPWLQYKAGEDENQCSMSDEWQNTAHDSLDFGCGISSIREVKREDRFQRILAVNDEVVNLFDVSEGYEDPSWIGKSKISKYSTPLADCSSLSREMMVILDESGRIWKHDLVSGSNAYLKVDHNDYRIIDTFSSSDDKILASTLRTLSLFDAKSLSNPLLLYQTIDNITFHKIISDNLVALSTAAELCFVDKRMPCCVMLSWNNLDAFGDCVVDSIDTVVMDDQTWLSMTSHRDGANWVAPLNSSNGLLESFQIPNRLPLPRTASKELQIIGSDLFQQDDHLYSFQLDNANHLRYVKSGKSGQPTCTVEEAWDPTVTTSDYVYEDSEVCESMRLKQFARPFIPKKAIKYDYRFVHSWIWDGVELDDIDSILCETESHSHLVGPIATKAINRQLSAKVDSNPIGVIEELTGPAKILISRW